LKKVLSQQAIEATWGKAKGSPATLEVGTAPPRENPAPPATALGAGAELPNANPAPPAAALEEAGVLVAGAVPSATALEAGAEAPNKNPAPPAAALEVLGTVASLNASIIMRTARFGVKRASPLG